MNIFKFFLTLGILASGHTYAGSQPEISLTKPGQVYSEYFTINEKERSFEEFNSNPLNEAFGPIKLLESIKSKVINLLSWTLHERKRPLPKEDYNRKLHFGRWINDPTDDTCMNTRAKVLVRDSEAEVTFRTEKNCVVETGRWFDRYSSTEYFYSREIQIDHMVPLKAAFLAGAFRWDYKTRCLFANYMGYQNHLIPASIRENTSKGDRSPDKYLPSELSYRCQYVKDWLAIKLIWKLNLTSDEVQAIHEIIVNYGCNPDLFKMNASEIAQQRKYIKDNIEYCVINQR